MLPGLTLREHYFVLFWACCPYPFPRQVFELVELLCEWFMFPGVGFVDAEFRVDWEMIAVSLSSAVQGLVPYFVPLSGCLGLAIAVVVVLEAYGV